MADTVKSTTTLTVVAEFADGDDRTMTVDDPNATIRAAGASAATAINNLGTFIKTNNILVGDKAGADFSRFKSAKVISRSITNLDLTP